MNKRSAIIVAGVLVAAMMGGMAGATHQALSMKAAAGVPRTVVVVQQPTTASPVAAPRAEPSDED